MLFPYNRFPSIIVRLRNKRLRVSLLGSNLYTPIKMVPFKMHIFLFKSLKSSCYNKNSGFKRLSHVVLIQKVSIFHSEIAEQTVKGVFQGSNLYTPIKKGTVQNAFFSMKFLKSSCYNKNSGFKVLSDVVLKQRVSIYHSKIP